MKLYITTDTNINAIATIMLPKIKSCGNYAK
jgi:hypothetical protein